MKQNKQFFRRLLAVAFWLAVWQAAAMAIGQEVFLVSPVQALRTLVQLLPRADFWQRVGFSSGRILLGFVLGAVVSVVLAVCAARWSAADALLAPVMQLVKATPVASFIILALVWVRGSALSVLISFLMVLPGQTCSCWKWQRCSVCLQAAACGQSGCLRCCRPSGRGAAWRWASAGKAAWRPRSSACPTAVSAMRCTVPRSPFPPGNCLRGPLSSFC